MVDWLLVDEKDVLPNGESSPIDTEAELFKFILTGFLG